jgi:AI-2E family transporter
MVRNSDPTLDAKSDRKAALVGQLIRLYTKQAACPRCQALFRLTYSISARESFPVLYLGWGGKRLAIGAMALIAYLIIGLPYALILAVIAGLLEIVPLFGPLLGAIPALVIALSVDPGKAIWVND